MSLIQTSLPYATSVYLDEKCFLEPFKLFSNNALAYDIETNPDGTICYSMVSNLTEVVIFTKNHWENLESILNRYRGTHLFAHNGGRFDWLFYTDYIERNYRYSTEELPDTYETLLTNSFMWIRVGRNYLNDSSLLFAGSLDAFTAAWSDVKKRTGEYDYNIYRDADYIAANLDKDLPYIASDVLGLARALYKYVPAMFDKLPITCSSGSYSKMWTMQYNKESIVPRSRSGIDDWRNIIIRGGEADPVIRQAYFGGMVYVNPGTVYTQLDCLSLDITSAYPHKLAQEYMPVGDSQVVELDMFFDNFTSLKAYIESYKLNCKCYSSDNRIKASIEYSANFDLKRGHVPCLPSAVISYHGSVDWLTHAVIDEKHYCTSDDLDFADAMYDVRLVHVSKLVLYYSYKGFYDSMEDMYQVKLNSEPGSVNYMVSKIFMNGVTGKFGERDHDLDYRPRILDERYEIITRKDGPATTVPVYVVSEYETILSGKRVTKLYYSRKMPRKHMVMSDVRVVSHTCALTRRQLLSVAMQLEHITDLYYTDTDSLYFAYSPNNYALAKKLHNPDKPLGTWEAVIKDGVPAVFSIVTFRQKAYFVSYDGVNYSCKWSGIKAKGREYISRLIGDIGVDNFVEKYRTEGITVDQLSSVKVDKAVLLRNSVKLLKE